MRSKLFSTVGNLYRICVNPDMQAHKSESIQVQASGIGNWQESLNNLLKRWNDLIHSKFTECQSDIMRIRIVTERNILEEVPWLTFYFKNCAQTGRKSSQKSKELREEGNRHFQKKFYSKAVECFDQAILYAPLIDNVTDDLALAYGNRSAALFYMEKYGETLADISLALHYGYPEHLRHKLELRKVKCLIKLGHFPEAQKVAKVLSEKVEEADVSIKIKDSLVEELAKCASTISLSSGDHCHSMEELSPLEMNKRDVKPPSLSYGKNDIIMQASSAVQLEYNSLKGRHLLASRDIVAGDTLIVERPFAAVLLPDHYRDHCHHCFTLLTSFVPCRECSRVRYCSDQCSRESWDSYHHIECQYLELLHSVGVAHLSLRVVLIAGLQFLIDFRNQYNKLHDIAPHNGTGRLPGISTEGKYERSYLTVYELMPHSESMEREDLFQYTVTAVLLLEVLRESGWFDSVSMAAASTSTEDTLQTDKLSDIQTHLGSLLLRHIQQLVCNAHAITKLQSTQMFDDSQVTTQGQVRVATAIYPTASLMNHSCDPTIISSFNKDTLVVRAIKDVKKGEEIFNCYGPHYKRMKYRERQQILRDQYFFHCQCEPCLSETDTANSFDCYICPGCAGTLTDKMNWLFCGNCQKNHPTSNFKKRGMEGEKLFLSALQLLEKQKVQGAIDTLQECLALRENILHRHHKHMAETQDCLARCYCIIGQYKKAVKYLDLSLETMKLIYGEKSIEYANELQKYAEILVHAQDMTKALKIAKQGLALFTVHYGASHDSTQELEKLVACISECLNSK